MYNREQQFHTSNLSAAGAPAFRLSSNHLSLTLQHLRQPVLPYGSMAFYLATVYREQLSAAELATVRLDRFQWLWNFAPLQVDCMHVPKGNGTEWTATLRKRVCRSAGQPAEAGAIRVAFNKGLRALEQYGIGVPYPMGRCFSAREAVEREHLSRRPWPQGVGGTDEHLEVIRVATDAYYRGRWVSHVFKRHNKTRLLAREGGQNGCWFVAKQGTGVFLRTGRTLYAQGRQDLARVLQINESMILAAAESQPWLGIGTDFAQKMLQHGRVGSLELEDIVQLCPLVRNRGYRTLVFDILTATYSPEIVSCSDECTAEYIAGPCVPGLLTGWRASLPCVCDSKLLVSNCAGTNQRTSMDRQSPKFPTMAPSKSLHTAINRRPCAS